jgi:hypothetical protein
MDTTFPPSSVPVFSRKSRSLVTTALPPNRASSASRIRLPCASESREVGVDAEGDRGVRVPELASDEDDVGALVDQHRGEAVAEVMHPKRRLA